MGQPDALRVVVAAHEGRWVPDDPAYLPVPVDAATSPEGGRAPAGQTPDAPGGGDPAGHAALGDLRALRWAWRNLDAAYLGISCDGRFLASNYHLDPRRRVASGDFLMHRLAGRGVVVPSETNYLLATNATRFAREHDPLVLDVARDVLGELDPAAATALERCLRVTRARPGLALAMRRDLADAFCAWLFEVLLDVEASFAGVRPEALGDGALVALATLLVDVWLDVTGTGFVEVSSVRVGGGSAAPSGAGWLEERYRRRYGGGCG